MSCWAAPFRVPLVYPTLRKNERIAAPGVSQIRFQLFLSRARSVLCQFLSAALGAVLALPASSAVPLSSSTPSHAYDAETLSRDRVCGSSEKILLHFRAVRQPSGEQHWSYTECSGKKAVGSVVTYDYDAFGNLIHQTGTTYNNYLFANEQFDPDLHLYYNRARYLNVSTGRFLTADSFEGDPQTPLALHKYLYAEGNPIDYVDPSGHVSVGEVIIGVAIALTVATFAVLHYTAHPVRIGLYWKNSFAWHNYLGGKNDPTAQADVAAIKQNALDALAQAFGPYGATVSEGLAAGSGGHTIEVDNLLSAKGCGQTRTSPSNYSWIDYSCILSNAENVLHSNDPRIVSPGVGRGVGNIGAHEVGHQLALTAVAPDNDLPGYYDGGNSADPTCYDGTGQVWTEKSKQELPGKIKPFF
jgi:RHS repeat-associated protein